MRFAYAVTTWSGAKLNETLSYIPQDSHVLVVNNKINNWPLAKGWNYAIDTLLWDEAFDACIVMNDDVVLRPDTGPLLVWALLEGQFQGIGYKGNPGHIVYDTGFLNGLSIENQWPDNRPELLLISARHASPSDARTDTPDWNLLNNAKPFWQPGPDFSCFCVSRRLGQIVGRFDENFVPAFFEDNDMHRRIQLAGYEAGAFAPYWHYLNGTTRTDPERAAAIRNGGFEDSKKHYCKKWGAPYDNASPIGRETFITPFER